VQLALTARVLRQLSRLHEPTPDDGLVSGGRTVAGDAMTTFFCRFSCHAPITPTNETIEIPAAARPNPTARMPAPARPATAQ
jgi:hypothetical protein